MCKGWWFLFNVEIIHILVKIIYTLTYTSEKLIVRKFKRKIDIIQIKSRSQSLKFIGEYFQFF